MASEEDNPRRKNRLAKEKSPYLLQHATNPVDWYPWSDEAFERARAEDKPVFLSIGYSTCHWCHVMEKEVFDDAEAARAINEAFVPIKVDREERPDIDALYMQVAQLMTGSGGWPLNVVMTPEKRPFFVATYIPKESRYGRVGMLELTSHISEAWRGKREELVKAADEVIEIISRSAKLVGGGDGNTPIREDALKSAFEELRARYDPESGGFGAEPKFPMSQNFTFLLRHYHRSGAGEALAMVEDTLSKMRLGGIYDHLGFGFHRYSTDALWLLPHFEKMLYDQALIALAYTEAFASTGSGIFRETASEVFSYILTELTSPEGLFFSAEDADSEGEEGKFYYWRKDEFIETLGPEDGALAAKLFSVEDEGNFSDEATGVRSGVNVLHMKSNLSEIAKSLGMGESELSSRLKVIRAKLFRRRAERVRPFKDDKALTDWNGLMVAAFSKAGAVMEEEPYVEAARSAVEFFIEEMVEPSGRLLHRYRQGEAAIGAYADDYAFFIFGLIELYQATFEIKYLKAAIELNNIFIKDFWDGEDGGFFFTREGAVDVIVRQKNFMDGALPSANSIAMMNLLRLARMTGDSALEEKAHKLSGAAAGEVEAMPSAYTELLKAVDFAHGPTSEVVLTGDQKSPETRVLLKAIRELYAPNTVVLHLPTGAGAKELATIAPFTAGFDPKGPATAYICSGFSCSEPTKDPEEIKRRLLRR